jgi:hypothetical protein
LLLLFVAGLALFWRNECVQKSDSPGRQRRRRANNNNKQQQQRQQQ